MKDAISEKIDELTATKRAMEEVKAEIESEANKAQSQMQTSIDKLKANISSIQIELENARASSKSYRAAFDAKDTELMELKGKLVDVTALNNGLSKDLEDTQKENLARLEQADAKINELTEDQKRLQELQQEDAEEVKRKLEGKLAARRQRRARKALDQKEAEHLKQSS